MSKRFASLLLSMVVIISLFHPTAYAALDTKITEATTKVTYTAKVQEGYYEVNIPKTADIGESEYMYFSANNVNIGENQLLTIRVNTDRTFTNGIFVLKNAFSEELETFLYRVDRNSGAEYSID
ncbi:MAG: hypothetical protein GX957_16295, partial [Clostridiaceae bacterium]|nr:hypothetical protein [Clostridiaceae bacterium]